MNNLAVLYLISVYDDRNNLKKFINNYLKFDSGVNHELIICFKNFDQDDDIFTIPELTKIEFTKVIDNKNYNDYDWGSYYRFAKEYSNKVIFFMNCHSRPIVNNWLKFFCDNYNNRSLLGPAGSFESMVNSALKGLHTKNNFKSIIYTISNFFDFPLFPNPHIRSNCFMISAENFLKLNFNQKYKYKKKGTWINESGRNGMTNQLKKKKFNIFIVNSDGKKFYENEWHLSKTYALEDQSKLIIEDKFSKIFSRMENEQKIKFQKLVWKNFN
ncbi:hypothetical protein [Candidatus Pelagibacter sp.]|uniref:hypothetical protein n=1 Tax=Candidatus Pelagibacter sp. TaxID=2024849 RepID=UPI003F82F6A1